MNNVIFLLGGNLGNREESLFLARKDIQTRIGIIQDKSSIYETSAWGKTESPDYLNQVIKIQTEFSAEKCLLLALEIEKNLGRIRFEKWGNRTIDIDILYYNKEIIETTNLIIPHPCLHLRRFTLLPLCEIAQLYTHPVFNKTNMSLLESCEDELQVKKLTSLQEAYIDNL